MKTISTNTGITSRNQLVLTSGLSVAEESVEPAVAGLSLAFPDSWCTMLADDDALLTLRNRLQYRICFI
jgi:hypothetical protein